MEKRGAIELQFNWIFVLVAGGLILALVISFIIMNSRNQEKADADRALSSIKTFISGTSSVRGKQASIDLKGLTISYSDKQISIGAFTREMNMLFSPKKVKGRELFVWSKDLSVPFLVTNVAYITTEQVKYVLIYDPSDKVSSRLLFQINDSFSNMTNYEQISPANLGSIGDENNYLTVFAFLGVPYQNSWSDIRGEVAAITIIPDDNNLTGKIDFIDISDGSIKADSYYIGAVMATGAIVSADYYNYDNLSKNIFFRIGAMSEILAKRAQMIEPGAGSDLNVRYETAYQRLNDIKSIMSELSQEPGKMEIHRAAIGTLIKELNDQNKKIHIRSGATVY